MASNPFPGGRSKSAPYKSTHIRVPDTIKDKLSKIADIYRALLAKNSGSSLGNFDLHLDKFIEGANPIYGVTTDDFKLVSTRQYEDLQALYQAAIAKNKELRRENESRARRQKFAIALLTEALKLKPNAGGAIKKEIQKAITELEN